MKCNCCEDRGEIIGWFADIPMVYCEEHLGIGIKLFNYFELEKNIEISKAEYKYEQTVRHVMEVENAI